MRTAVYIDGFNLFYRGLRGTPYRWLDLFALSRQLLQKTNEIVLMRYVTARVNSTPHDPDKHVRQDAYIRALKAHIPCLTVHEGTFLKSVVTAKLVTPINGTRFVEVHKTEEKGSDVNLAVHLVNDAWRDAFDVALVISNDSDLAEGIALARQRGKPVGVANPSANPEVRMNFKLYEVASFHRRVEERFLRKALLPTRVGSIEKPATW